MQCPPAPGPGKNGRYPYGFVAAASMTSMTSSSSSRLSSANSLTSAMFTARNVFSSSLVISAASADDTVCSSPVHRPSSAAARAAHRGVTPPTTRGTSSCACRSLPGSIRSGLKATNTSVPTRSPRAVSGRASSSFVDPT
jgi:hypothetical protein